MQKYKKGISIFMRHILSHFYCGAPLKKILISFLNLAWSWRHGIFVFSIFVVALLLRLQSFGDPHYHYIGDYNRDYLIAHHILAYHEFPLIGSEGRFGRISHSPAYFYFLALPLLIKDDIIFLGFFNVLLQMGALILVYFFGRAMFGKPVGLGALAIFAMNQNIIYQSSVVWQPHIMQPFLLLSLFLLFFSYTHKSYRFLLLSIVFFVFANVLYQSVLALIPFYFITAFLILRANQTQSWQQYAGAIAYFLGTSILFYAPLLFYVSKNQVAITSFLHSASAFFAGNNEGIISHFLSRTEFFAGVFFIHNPFVQLVSNNVSQRASLMNVFSGAFISSHITFLSVLMGFLVLILFYFYGNREKEKKIMFLFVFGAIASFLAVTTLVSSDDFYVRHLTPLFGIFAICIAELTYGFISRKSWGWIIAVPITLILVFSSSQDRIFGRLKTAIQSVRTDPMGFFVPHYMSPPFATPLIQEIVAIKEKEHRKDFSFFDIRVYGNPRLGYWVGTLWVALERNFSAHLVKVDDNNSWHFSPVHFPQYIFFYCDVARNVNPECMNSFLREYPDFRIIKELSLNPPIYEAQRMF